MAFYTVIRLTEDGDTIPFEQAYRTVDRAIAAARADAEEDGINTEPATEPINCSILITSVRDEDENYTESWMITRHTV